MSEVKAPATLTDRQIAWCRKNIRAFDIAWRDAQKAEAHKVKTYDALNVQPGTVGVPSERTDSPSQ